MRSSGPGEMPLYPIVLRIRLGASSTVMGAISSVKSLLATSCDPVGARNDVGCWAPSRVVAAAKLAIFRKSRLCIRHDHGNARIHHYSSPPTLFISLRAIWVNL